jgi:hypothetical protein
MPLAGGSAGNECVNCNMPKIEAEIADVNIRSHTFRFAMPSETENLKVPNTCNVSHARGGKVKYDGCIPDS